MSLISNTTLPFPGFVWSLESTPAIAEKLLAGEGRRNKTAEPAWQGFSTEVYIVLGVIYFAFCFAMSKYSRGLEREFGRARTR